MTAFLKRIIKIFVGLIVVLLVLLVVLFIFMGSIVEKGINSAAPALLGVNTHVDSVSISPIKGVIHLKNLTLANPEGYTQDKKLFEVTEFYVNVNMASLFSDTIRIRKILIKGPGCTYEDKKGTSNIDALIAKLNKGKPADPKAKTEEPAPTEQPKEKKAGKKVIIDDLTINDTRLAYSSSITAGQFMTIPILSISLKDIGKKDGGATFSEALTQIMNAILNGCNSAISGMGDLLGSASKSATDATKATTEALDSGVKETSKAVGSALDEVGGLFKSKKKE
jgi:uncharacterized protein involved in outer membrane biogenesis